MSDEEQRPIVYNSSLELALFLLSRETILEPIDYNAVHDSIVNNFFAVWRRGQELKLNLISPEDYVDEENDIVQLMAVFLILMEQELINQGTLPENSPLFSIVSVAEDTDVIANALESLAHTIHFHLILRNKAKSTIKLNQ